MRDHAVKPYNDLARNAERLAAAQEAFEVCIGQYDALSLFVLAFDRWRDGQLDWVGMEQARVSLQKVIERFNSP